MFDLKINNIIFYSDGEYVTSDKKKILHDSKEYANLSRRSLCTFYIKNHHVWKKWTIIFEYSNNPNIPKQLSSLPNFLNYSLVISMKLINFNIS